MLDVFRCAAEKRGCWLDAQVWRQFEHFKLDERSRPVMHLKLAMESCGVEPYLAASGGGSDANVFNLAGLQMAVMHIGLVDAHSKKEHILKADLVAVARVMAELARQSILEEREAR
jgi:tripeptide aminopeptidase